MRQVYLARHPTEAHLVKGLLESHGIAAVVQGEPLFAVRGETPVTHDTLPSVWVTDDAQRTEALELIREAHATGSGEAAGTPWHCPNCRETVEPQFVVCWQCGAERPETP